MSRKISLNPRDETLRLIKGMPKWMTSFDEQICRPLYMYLCINEMYSVTVQNVLEHCAIDKFSLPFLSYIGQFISARILTV